MAASGSSELQTRERTRTIEDYYNSKDMSEYQPVEIETGLFLGCGTTGRNKAALIEAGIKHILIVENGIYPPYKDTFDYLVIPTLYLDFYDLKQHLPNTNAYIDHARSNGGVLVHCSSGISSSPSVVIAYLMYENKMSFFDAMQHVIKRLPSAWPNDGFQEQLQQFEL